MRRISQRASTPAMNIDRRDDTSSSSGEGTAGPSMRARLSESSLRSRANLSQASGATAAPRTPIFIANRDDARGGGREWDHASIQSLTNRETVSVASKSQIEAEGLGHLEGQPLREALFKDKTPSRYTTGVPNVTTEGKSGDGLLVVPGGPVSLPGEQPAMRFPPKSGREESALARNEHQAYILRDARNTGQPVLAICGGSWHTVQAFGGNTQTSPEFEAKHVADMPFFDPANKTGLSVAHHKVAQHGAQMVRDSLLGHIIDPPVRNQPVHIDEQNARPPLHVNINSVHWAHAMARLDSSGQLQLEGRDPMAVDSRQGTATSELLAINTLANDDELGPTVEGFEARHGAPVIGVQHHPEALAGRPVDSTAYPTAQYTAELGQSSRLMNYMAKAGDAFLARRNMTREFEAAVAKADVPDNPTNTEVLAAIKPRLDLQRSVSTSNSLVTER